MIKPFYELTDRKKLKFSVVSSAKNWGTTMKSDENHSIKVIKTLNWVMIKHSSTKISDKLKKFKVLINS